MYNIVFHRHYRISETLVKQRVGETDFAIMSDEEKQEEAVTIAKDYMSDEMCDFTDNIDDFVSHTVETNIINNE